jgi:predicted dehydrogenase
MQATWFGGALTEELHMGTRVFLSHSADDGVFVDEVTKSLRTRGWAVTLLDRNVTPLLDPFDAINQSLISCDQVVVVLSPNYLRSNWCNDELKAIWALRQSTRLPVACVLHNLTRQQVLAERPLIGILPMFDGSNSIDSVVDSLVQPASRIRTWTVQQHEPIPVVLAGIGRWALERTVFPLYRQGAQANDKRFEIVAITDLLGGVDEFQKVNDVLKEQGAHEIRYFPSLFSALAHLQPHQGLAVLINTPNTFHDQLAGLALLQNCHVYSERPINVLHANLGVTQALISAAARNGLYFYSGTQRRLEYPYVFMASQLQDRSRFGALRSIRCTLASGRRGGGLGNWRRYLARAGGGVVIDEGYHLLDMAVWLGQLCEPRLRVLSRHDVRGTCEFDYCEVRDEETHELAYDDGVETSAYGRLELPGNIKLVFDLTYAAPRDSVFECIELRDEYNTRLRLLRDKPQRRPSEGRPAEPGRVLYQSGDGYTTLEGYANDEGTLEMPRPDELERFSARDYRPLRQFIERVRSGQYDPDEALKRGFNDCDARFLLSTQELLHAIYDIGRSSGSRAQRPTDAPGARG